MALLVLALRHPESVGTLGTQKLPSTADAPKRATSAREMLVTQIGRDTIVS